MRNVLLGLIVGALLGAAGSFLLATAPRAETAPEPMPDAPTRALTGAAPDDPARYTTLGTGEDAGYLAATLREVFPRPEEDPARKAMAILNFVAQRTKMKFTATASGTVVLQQGFGYCNGMALAFAALCRQAGLPARVNALHNIGWMEAHNTAEVYYGGKWHCFDPTYNTFFTASAGPANVGEVVSLRELMANPGGYHCYQMASALWTGSLTGDPQVHPLSPEQKYGNWSFTLAEFYDHLFRTACPVIYDAAERVSYPILLDLRKTNTLDIGKPDGDLMDTYGKHEGKYPRFHGIPYLGQVRLGNAMHLLSIRTPGPGNIRVVYTLGQGSSGENVEAVGLKNFSLGSFSADSNGIVIEGYVQSRDAEVLVLQTGAAAFVDAMHVEFVPAE